MNADLRADFPALHQEVHGRPLVYLDNGATALKPRQVLDAIASVYERDCANIHRGVHTLSQRATDAYEAARCTTRDFIGAAHESEVVFLRGTTEAINLVAQVYGRPRLGFGDEVLVSELEHHANIVPWQILANQIGCKVIPIPVTDVGELDLDAFASLLSSRTRLVCVAHISNVLGTVLPVKEIVRLAKAHGAAQGTDVAVLIDGAQAAPHHPIDVQDLGCDFYAFSAHKVFGPTGTGALWAPRALLDTLPPWQGGGDMIRQVSFDGTTFADPPARFEAGTPNIAGVIGFAAAMKYVTDVDLDVIAAHEQALLAHVTESLQTVDGLRIIGTAKDKAAVVSFVIEGIHPHDVGTILDGEGVAVRTGHHCAQPLMKRFGVPATTRASFAMYNTREDADALVAGLGVVADLLG